MMKQKNFGRIVTLMVFACLLSVFASCAANTKGRSVRSCDEADYQRLGMSKTEIAVWEDGMRTSGGKGNFEWWYFDAKTEDGSTLVIVFYTKSILEINDPLTPLITVTLSDPDGKKILSRLYEGDRDDCHFSKDQCDVRIGKNTVKGDLHNYAIHLEFEDIRADLKLKGVIPAWRPETGHSFFINGSKETYFAWLPSVPQGEVRGSFSIGEDHRVIEGSGYHDHNWGDALMARQMHDWYWGRAEVGPYTVITSWITATEAFGGESGATFALWRDGELLAEDGKYVACELEDVYVDPFSKKPVANRITYDYNDGVKRYQVIFEREKDIEKREIP